MAKSKKTLFGAAPFGASLFANGSDATKRPQDKKVKAVKPGSLANLGHRASKKSGKR